MSLLTFFFDTFVVSQGLIVMHKMRAMRSKIARYLLRFLVLTCLYVTCPRCVCGSMCVCLCVCVCVIHWWGRLLGRSHSTVFAIWCGHVSTSRAPGVCVYFFVCLCVCECFGVRAYVRVCVCNAQDAGNAMQVRTLPCSLVGPDMSHVPTSRAPGVCVSSCEHWRRRSIRTLKHN